VVSALILLSEQFIFPTLHHFSNCNALAGWPEEQTGVGSPWNVEASALNFKKTKKEIFLSVFKMGGMQKRLVWQATDKQEEQDILKNFPTPGLLKRRIFLVQY
jgi:hypothetical protein